MKKRKIADISVSTIMRPGKNMEEHPIVISGLIRKMVIALSVILLCTSNVLASSRVDEISIDGPIGPAYAYFVSESIQRAEADGANAFLILMDTPGGLDTSMRDIVKAIENAKLPVVTYIYPSGSRAASAGVFIVMSSDVAAMAPGTNIGAAHPVTMGGKLGKEMEKKVTNDAVAYIESLALQKGRNAEWAGKAVRKSVSITADQASKIKVIDIVAGSISGLLNKINGWKINKQSGHYTLDTKGAVIKKFNMGFQYRVLKVISDPNIAYILMLIGMWGIFFELASPGAIFPGVIGALSLILAFVAFQTIPVNYAGVLLIILSIVLFILEVKIVSHGMLAVGGIISFVLGSVLMFDTSSYDYTISWALILTAVVLTSLFFIVALGLALKARLKKPVTGMEGLIGNVGDVISITDKKIKVFIDGAYWNAYSDSNNLKTGDKIIIEKIDNNMLLKIKKKED
ncbi:MAG: nodulation protein NfeD [Deltaproteobacteria bacterium]|nr:nodulation protein NfeD [Deltaproteobacteria bacterium]